MNSNFIFMPAWISFLSGLILFLLPRKAKLFKDIFSVLVLGALFFGVIKIFSQTLRHGSMVFDFHWLGINLSFIASLFSTSMLLAITFLLFMISIYSIRASLHRFNALLHWSLTASAIVLLTDNLIVLLVLWGLLAVFLYMMILMGKPGSEGSAYKALVMVGGSDVLMLIGAALIYYLTGTVGLSQISISLNSGLAIVAFVLLLIGALTKAGAMPFHTWLIDASMQAPAPVMALFPGVLDKILGVYLLARIALDLFVMIPNSAMSIVLMAVGSLTIIFAGGMALVQKNFTRLLAYSTVSQVGYLVMGIGTALPLGIIGAVFHMFNNTIYKTSLFFAAGAVQAKTGATDFSKLGGLAKFMPVTFITTFISALAISGIPPLNGFFSKLLIYQGVLSVGANSYGHGWYFTIFIIAAMFGSVLTLAYLLKAIHSVFFAQPSFETMPSKKQDVAWTMWLPMVVLSVLSILFGVFARYPLQIISGFKFRMPILASETYPVFGFSLSIWLVVIGIVIGLVIYLLQRTQQVKSGPAFIGGEEIRKELIQQAGGVTSDEATIGGDNFYDSVKDVGVIGEAYRVADKQVFDIFEQGKKIIAALARVGKRIHNGLLHNYLGWLFLGVIAIIVIFFLLLIK